MRIRLLALLLVALALWSCRRQEDQVGSRGAPLVLVLSPAHGADAARVKELEKLLEAESGLELELRVAPSSDAAVRMAGSPNTDAALLTLFEYLFCRQLYGVNAGLRVRRKGGAETHHGELVVKKGSGIAKLTDLDGKKMAYVDRYSTTGYVLAAKLLADAKVNVTPSFAGSHEAALSEVRAGRAAGAATYAGATAGMADLESVATTPEMPNEPVFFRSGLDPEKRRKLAAALSAVAGREDGKRVLGGMANIEGFAPTDDAAYDAAKALIGSIGQSVKNLIPNGWLVANEKESKPGDLAP
ncbi:MAG: PhnD/SsuA/transferrin family substrate-binding protein [Myxococcales bacterium]|nr:PhnD/SsuA/transferrin family substrate-binding protein [Myxococcales bacterium]